MSESLRRHILALLARAIPEPNTGCQLWLGALTGEGYPCVKIAGRCLYLHRLALGLRLGRRLRRLEDAHHVCCVRACVNGAHLEAKSRSAHRALHNYERHGARRTTTAT